jgi:hypothetical protein
MTPSPAIRTSARGCPWANIRNARNKEAEIFFGPQPTDVEDREPIVDSRAGGGPPREFDGVGHPMDPRTDCELTHPFGLGGGGAKDLVQPFQEGEIKTGEQSAERAHKQGLHEEVHGHVGRVEGRQAQRAGRPQARQHHETEVMKMDEPNALVAEEGLSSSPGQWQGLGEALHAHAADAVDADAVLLFESGLAPAPAGDHDHPVAAAGELPGCFLHVHAHPRDGGCVSRR